MAMTKKEQAAMQAAIDRADTLAALRWTQPVAHDVAPPVGLTNYSTGWDFNVHTLKVEPAWTDTITHGSGPAPEPGRYRYAARQGAISLFATKVKALRAMRHEVEKESAAKLLKIDRMIAEAESQENEGTQTGAAA